ncbi:hypothetical protein MP638_006616 [Amoeboaphelidium occidentale]|nr:hypothetical protein MP638_006616 [Amoeboaphelidium occidentale]
MGKKKGVKMPLGEFLGDAAKASWADEAVELPDMPVSSSGGGDGAFGGSGGEYSRSDYGHRQDRDRGYSQERRPRMEREKKPLPTHPPYCAFVGNLSIDATEQDVSEFFVNSKSVRIIRDFDKRSKGFGYVEFETLDELKVALEKDGVEMMGRMLRLDVAEGQRDQNRPIERRQDREYQPRRQEEPEEVLPSNWRRAEPVAPSAPSRSTFTPRDRERDNGTTTTSFGGRKDFGSRDRGDRNAPFERKQYSDRPSFGGQGAAAASGEGRPERRGPSSYNDGPRPRRNDERDVDFSAFGARRMQAADAKPAVDAKPAPVPAPAASKSNPFGSARAVDTNSKLRTQSTETKPREKKEASTTATATGGAAANPWGNFRRNQE